MMFSARIYFVIVFILRILKIKPEIIAYLSNNYSRIIQNIEEQCLGIFIADIYLKIFEDNVLNNFDQYFFIFHRYL